MNDKITKGYYVLETELAVLFALQKIENLYGIQLECAESMTKEQLYRTVFNLLKKGRSSLSQSLHRKHQSRSSSHH